jgi:hypothetical protein
MEIPDLNDEAEETEEEDEEGDSDDEKVATSRKRAVPKPANVSRSTTSRKPVSRKAPLRIVDNEKIPRPVFEVPGSDDDIAACSSIDIIDISTPTVAKPRAITSKQKNTSIHVIPDSGGEDDDIWILSSD